MVRCLLKEELSQGSKRRPNRNAKAIAEAYLALCRDPFSDLQAWIDIDRKGRTPTSSRHRDASHGRTNAATTPTDPGLRRNALREVSSRLGSNDYGRSAFRDLPAQSRAGSAQHNELQQVRGDRTLNDDPDASPADAGSEISGLS